MDNVQAMEAELLAESVKGIGPIHDVLDIDAETRTIIVPTTELLFGVATDQNVERKYFRCPKIVGDNIDLSTLSLRVHFENAMQERDKYIVEDLQTNGNYVTFSWRLSEKVLRYNGTVNFTICAVQADGDGVLTNRWNTTLATGTVLNGLEVDDLTEDEAIEARDVLQQLLNLLNTQKTETIQDVKDEGAVQISNVKAEGDNQIKAVEDKGASTLATIPEDYTEMSKQVDRNTRFSAPVVVQSAEGKSIVVKDSAKMPILGLNVFGKSEQFTTTGKNLLPIYAKTRTSNGITYTVNDDGSIHVKGTSTAVSWMWVFTKGTDNDKLAYIPAGEYFLSGVEEDANITGYINGFYPDDSSIPQHNDGGNGRKVTLTQDARVYYQIMIANGVTVDTVVRPQLEVGTSATEWEPYTGGIPSPNPDYPQEIVSIENPTVDVFGKNLLEITATSGVYHGCNVAVNEDGSVVIDGTAVTEGSIIINKKVELPKGSYFMSGTRLVAFRNDKSGKHLQTHFAGSTIIIDDPSEYLTVCVYANKNQTFDNLVTYPMIRVIEYTDETYEKFIAKQSINSSRTLLGIPVTSNGNYTDSNGQQWVCDEVDFERGVYIQRIRQKVFDGTEILYNNWFPIMVFDIESKDLYAIPGTDVICNYFTHAYIGNTAGSTLAIGSLNVLGFTSVNEMQTLMVEKYEEGNPVILQYILNTPIETPLTADEILAYKALYTNYLSTTVLNDSEASIKLVYGTDTKTYIDNKFAELLNS